MSGISLLLLGGALWLQGAPAPAADSALIATILFIGNDHTREEILVREMQQRAGDPFDPRIAEADRQRIENLRLFTRVELQVLPGADGVTLLYLVNERWYLFPYPLLFIHDRDWSKLSYGAGARHENFRGRNITLLGNFWLGYDPAVNLTYSNPWIHSRHRLAFSAQASWSRNENLSPRYNGFKERHAGLLFGLSKRFGYYTRASVGAGYREVRLPPELGLTRSAAGLDRIAQFSAGFTYDNRDYSAYPRHGWFVDAGVSLRRVAAASDYLFAACDLRRYQPLPGGGILAGRVRLDASSGRVPVHSLLYLGYGERIRGHFREVLEGEQRLLAGAELRWPIIRPRFFNLVPEDRLGYLRNLPFALHGALFYDTGLIAKSGWARGEQQRRGGFGAGVAVQLPYVELIRFERAWDLSGRGEYLIDMKVWF
ncbi:MAG TPA: BamA/TamA family outer membrane protein [bacterium]|nr:BamA/TamA family outer membrane protein [bacterium]HPR88669.1 BamA/TamA family outer membrane protein [bacterium]